MRWPRHSGQHEASVWCLSVSFGHTLVTYHGQHRRGQPTYRRFRPTYLSVRFFVVVLFLSVVPCCFVDCAVFIFVNNFGSFSISVRFRSCARYGRLICPSVFHRALNISPPVCPHPNKIPRHALDKRRIRRFRVRISSSVRPSVRPTDLSHSAASVTGSLPGAAASGRAAAAVDG